MEIRLLNQNFVPIEVIDIYTSFIWTDRYYECGDFELKIPAAHIPFNMQVGLYLTYDRSDHIMVIETMQTDKTAEDGSIVTISGRSAEILLDRRVIYEYRYVKDKPLEDYIQLLLNNAVISPSKEYRRISNFKFAASGDADISAVKIEAQHQGESLYEVICDICRKNRIGWKIVLEHDNLTFSLYNGKDKTDAVIFSEDMDNIAECQLLRSVKDYRNCALVIGEEDEDGGKVYAEAVPDGAADIPTGLLRRELAVSCSAHSKTKDENGNKLVLSAEQYAEVLRNEGREKLTEHRVTGTVNGKTDSVEGQFQYGVNFKMGDIVMLDMGFTAGTPSRVTESTFSVGTDGFEQYQSFENADEN